MAKVETSERFYFNSVCMTLKLFFIIIAVLLTLVFGSIGGVLAHQFQWLPYRLVVRLEYLLFGHTLGKSDAYDQRAELLKSTRLPYTIAMLGDSLTAYAEWNILLKRHDILNFGIAGDTSERMLRRVAANPIKGKMIFVMAGINDLSHHIAPPTVAGHIESTIDLLDEANTVFLQSTLFTRDARLNEAVAVLNAALKLICRKRKCTYLDVNAAVAPSGQLKPGMSIDAVHINGDAYEQWGKIVARHVPGYPMRQR